MQSVLQILNTVIEPYIEFIAPTHCEVCDEKTTKSDPSIYLCKKCYYNLPLAPSSEQIKNQMLENFNFDEIFIDEIYCLISSKDTSAELLTNSGTDIDYFKLVYSLKYAGREAIGRYLGELLAKLLQNNQSTNYDYILPLPLHKVKKRERGFNQSELIASGISKILNLKMETELALRTVYTSSQTTLDKDGRKSNVSNIFKIDEKKLESIQRKSILVIDDVFTTGSTANSLAKCLKDAGANKVDVACVIKA